MKTLQIDARNPTAMAGRRDRRAPVQHTPIVDHYEVSEPAEPHLCNRLSLEHIGNGQYGFCPSVTGWPNEFDVPAKQMKCRIKEAQQRTSAVAEPPRLDQGSGKQ